MSVMILSILIICGGIYFPICYAIWTLWGNSKPKAKVETKPNSNIKPWFCEGLHPPTPAERKRRREEKHIELMDRSYNSLVPQVEFILKRNGWTKGEDNLWSNKNHTNLTFNEAMEEHNLLVLEDVIAHTERINKT